jgi:hypothetical protein
VKGGVALKPRIGNENIDGSELFDGLREHRGHVVFFRNVGFEFESPGAGFLDFGNDSVRRVIAIDIVHHHIRAGLSQGDGNAAADAGIRARNDCLLAN